jgi:hypothetical protein
MDIGSLLLILALLIPIGLFIARPLLKQDTVSATPEEDRKEHERSTLLAERDQILDALEELDFDNALGKIPAEDYASQRARLVAQGADVLRKLDELNGDSSEADIERRIEAAIATRRITTSVDEEVEIEPQPQHVLVDADDEVEIQLAARRRTRQDKSAGFCPQCGRPVQQSDRFCPKCGHALA